MSIEAGLHALMSGASATTALVGSRYYWESVPDPDETKPYLFFSKLTDNEPGHMTGSSNLAEVLVQATFVGSTLAEAVSVREALRSDLHTYQASSGTIRTIRISDSSNIPPLPQSGEPVGVHAVTSDYTIWYAQSAPSPIPS